MNFKKPVRAKLSVDSSLSDVLDSAISLLCESDEKLVLIDLVSFIKSRKEFPIPKERHQIKFRIANTILADSLQISSAIINLIANDMFTPSMQLYRILNEKRWESLLIIKNDMAYKYYMTSIPLNMISVFPDANNTERYSALRNYLKMFLNIHNIDDYRNEELLNLKIIKKLSRSWYEPIYDSIIKMKKDLYKLLWETNEIDNYPEYAFDMDVNNDESQFRWLLNKIVHSNVIGIFHSMKLSEDMKDMKLTNSSFTNESRKLLLQLVIAELVGTCRCSLLLINSKEYMKYLTDTLFRVSTFATAKQNI